MPVVRGVLSCIGTHFYVSARSPWRWCVRAMRTGRNRQSQHLRPNKLPRLFVLAWSAYVVAEDADSKQMPSAQPCRQHKLGQHRSLINQHVPQVSPTCILLQQQLPSVVICWKWLSPACRQTTRMLSSLSQFISLMTCYLQVRTETFAVPFDAKKQQWLTIPQTCRQTDRQKSPLISGSLQNA